MNDFVSQWLRFDRILTASKDKRKFPTFTRETAMAMTEEARDRMSRMCSDPSATISSNERLNRKSPTRIAGLLPHKALAVSRPRRHEPSMNRNMSRAAGSSSPARKRFVTRCFMMRREPDAGCFASADAASL